MGVGVDVGVAVGSCCVDLLSYKLTVYGLVRVVKARHSLARRRRPLAGSLVAWRGPNVPLADGPAGRPPARQCCS